LIDEEAIKTEIQELENRYADAANLNDVESVLNYYAEYIISYSSYKLPISGKEVYANHLQKILKRQRL
jgi:ketosteroid isomerase-like protein